MGKHRLSHNNQSLCSINRMIWMFILFQSGSSFSQSLERSEYELIRLPEIINSPYEESKPVLIGNTLFFERSHHPENKGGFEAGQDIWMSEPGHNDNWTKPSNDLPGLNNINSNIIAGFSNENSNIIYCLKYLNISNSRYAEIYRYAFQNGRWGNPKSIGLDPIKVGSAYHDFFVHPSEKVIIISMKGLDTIGEEDLYICLKNESGIWEGPFNLGVQINTRGFELSPFVSQDGQKLFFASNGHDGYGDADIYVTERIGKSWLNWKKPVNLGQPVNSSMFDAYFYMTNKGEAFFASNRQSENTDIYRFKSRNQNIYKPQEAISMNTITAQNVEEKHPFLYNLTVSVYFDHDESILSEDMKQNLITFIEKISQIPIKSIDVVGYTDPTGSIQYNFGLSQSRADATANFLQSNGLKDIAIKARGIGVWPEAEEDLEKMRLVKVMVYL